MVQAAVSVKAKFCSILLHFSPSTNVGLEDVAIMMHILRDKAFSLPA